MKYTDVIFKFDGDDGASSEERGTATVRDSEMMLEVEWAEWPECQPYLIRGIDGGGFYEGYREGPAGDAIVHAKWKRQGDVYEGTWVEDDYDYRFTFRLPATSRPRTSK
jgi:hypothetical protein